MDKNVSLLTFSNEEKEDMVNYIDSTYNVDFNINEKIYNFLITKKYSSKKHFLDAFIKTKELFNLAEETSFHMFKNHNSMFDDSNTCIYSKK